MLYLGVSDTHEAQIKIIQALTRKFRLDPRTVAEACPFNYTGADFYALCSDAMLKAMSRKAQEIDEKIVCPAERTTTAIRTSLPDHAPILPRGDGFRRRDGRVRVRGRLQSGAERAGAQRQCWRMEHCAMVQQKFPKETINSDATGNSKGKGKTRALE